MSESTSSSRTFVTGFGPFLDVQDNPSAKVAQALGRPFRILEVSFEGVDRFLAELDPASFDRLVMIGVARGRKLVMPELFARDHIGHTKDVRGLDRFGEIVHEAPLLLDGGLWTPEVLGALAGETTVRASMDAGTYLCNYAYYQAVRRFPDKRVGFLHLPDESAMPIDEQIRLARKLVEATEA